MSVKEIMKPEITIKNVKTLQGREPQIIKAIIGSYYELMAELQLARCLSGETKTGEETFVKVVDKAIWETTQFIAKYFDGLEVEIDPLGGAHPQI
jgi:hypothetical protein